MNSANPTSGASILVKNEIPKGVGCPICLKPFHGRKVEPMAVETQCGHFFDQHCINTWLNRPDGNPRSCAVCRQPPLLLQSARLYEDSEPKPLQDCRNRDLDALQERLRIEPGIVIVYSVLLLTEKCTHY